MHPYNIFITITAVVTFIGLVIETCLRRSTLKLAQDAEQKLKETKASLVLLRADYEAVTERKCNLEEQAKSLRFNEREAIGALGRLKIASNEALAHRQQKHDEALDELRVRLLDLVQAQCRQRGLLFSEDCARITDPWHALEWLEFAAKDS